MTEKNSIKRLLHKTNYLMILLAITPLLISVVMYTRHLFTYENSINNISRANSISTEVDEKILEEAWGLTYGQISPQEFTEDNIILTIKKRINEIKENTQTPQENSTLDVALRALNNLESYIDQIIDNLNNNEDFEHNEMLMAHIESSIGLVHEIIQKFVEVEINLAAERSQKVQQSLILLSIIEVCIICAIIYIARKTSQRLINQIQLPIEKMVKMAAEISQGHLNYRVVQLPENEIKVLGDNMNKMADNLTRLLEENALKQYNLAQSEVRTLQAQITPHFIYNSLDAILALAEAGDMENVQAMTYALSDFFRISLSKGKDWITIEKEVSHIRDYLFILKIRYGDTLSYTIDVSEEIYTYPILKMILQPIVENAVYHGTKLVRRPGKVAITGALDKNGLIHFSITDNGKGILPDKLVEINNELENGLDTEFRDGYGLFNVNKRLLLYYGNEAKITVKSTYEEGTEVDIRIPIYDKEGDFDNV